MTSAAASLHTGEGSLTFRKEKKRKRQKKNGESKEVEVEEGGKGGGGKRKSMWRRKGTSRLSS